MDLTTVREVVVVRGRADLPTWREGDAVLAGGTWLLSQPQRHLRRLVDLGSLGWPAFTVHDDGGLEVAATATIGALAAAAGDPAPLLRTAGAVPSPAPWTFLPGWTVGPLVRACVDGLVASFKVWHEATVGGNVCLALPAGSMTTLMTALEAEALVWSPDGGERRTPVADLVTGDRRTSLAPGELLRSLHVPAAALHATYAVRRASLAAHGRTAAFVVGRREPGSPSVTVSVTGATPRPYVRRLPVPDPDGWAAEADALVAGDWFDDVHGAPDWRRHLVGVLGAEVLAELADPGSRA